MRDEYTRDLQTANRLTQYAAVQNPPVASDTGGAAGGIVGGAGPQNILDTAPKSNVPADIQTLPNKLGVLKGALDSGKLSETDFKGRTADMLSSIRSRYPLAYRETIDQAASSVLGFNPANAYVQGLISDYNKNLVAKNDEHKFWEHKLATEGLNFANGEAALKRFRQDGNVEAAAAFLGPNQRRKYDLEMSDLELKNRAAQGTANKEWYTLNAKEHANGIMKETLHGVAAGQMGVITYDDANKLITDGYQGTKNLTADQWTMLGQMPLAWKQQVLAKIDARFAQTDELGNSHNRNADSAELEKIKKGVSEVFDQMHTAFAGDKDKGIGLAFLAMHRANALTDQGKYDLFINKDNNIGASAVALKAQLDAFGPSIIEKMSTEDIVAKFKAPFQKIINSARTDLSTDDPRHTPDFKIAKDAVDALTSERAKANPDYQMQMPKTFNALFDLIDHPEYGMVSPKTSDKTKAIMFNKFFDPANRGILAKIESDGKDLNGRNTTGAQSTFARFTRPDIVELAKKQGPQALANYVDFINTTWEQDIFKRDFMKLNSLLGTDEVIQKAGTAFTNYGFAWDTSTHELQVYDKVAPTRNLLRGSYAANSPQAQAKDTVARLNTGFHALANVAEGTGKDVDHYILEHLMSAMGNNFDITKIKGVPADIINAVIVARTKAEEIEKQRKANEEKYKLK